MSFILDNFGRTLQKRKESATMILISENSRHQEVIKWMNRNIQ